MSHVHLRKNRLSGQLTHAFANSSSLVTLDVGENNLTGPIPNSGNLLVLSVLLLKANHFDGEFPAQLCLLEQLNILDISQNKLSGPLPSCLGKLAFKENNRKTFHSYWFNGVATKAVMHVNETVKFTTMRNSYLYKDDIFNFVSGIDLSWSRFTGEIPPALGNLRGMRALNLSHNNLTGSIPATFSELKQIESMDLSYNNLNGGIPPQVDELNSLAIFNVSCNDLSGKTPDRKNQFGTFDESSYLGNPLLCGPPLQNSCGEKRSPSQPVLPKVEAEEDDGFMDMLVFYVTFVVCYIIVVLTIVAILYINPFWRRRWFYFIENCIDACYYFSLNSFHKLSNFRRP